MFVSIECNAAAQIFMPFWSSYDLKFKKGQENVCIFHIYFSTHRFLILWKLRTEIVDLDWMDYFLTLVFVVSTAFISLLAFALQIRT